MQIAKVCVSSVLDAQAENDANVCVSLQQAIAYEKPMAKGAPMPAAAKTGTAPTAKTGTAAADGAPAAPATTNAAPNATPHGAEPAPLNNPGADSRV